MDMKDLCDYLLALSALKTVSPLPTVIVMFLSDNPESIFYSLLPTRKYPL